ncbi:hypothetical protein KXX53_008039, partial [Aspergillus fumigatus]
MGGDELGISIPTAPQSGTALSDEKAEQGSYLKVSVMGQFRRLMDNLAHHACHPITTAIEKDNLVTP